MSRNGVIFGALFIGFLFYVTARGNLTRYFDLLWQTNSSSASGQQISLPLFSKSGLPKMGGNMGLFDKLMNAFREEKAQGGAMPTLPSLANTFGSGMGDTNWLGFMK